MNLLPTTYKDVRGYEDAGGKFYPGSGSILDLLFPSKMEWIDQAYLDEGTRLHRAMQDTINGMLAHEKETGKLFWPQHQDQRVNELIQHLAAWNFVPVEAETPRCSTTWGHAGTPDALLMRGDLYVIPDWKFAESIDERYLYQLQSYQPFFSHLPTRPALMIWQVNREGKVKPIVVKPKAVQWAEFLAASTVMKKRLR